MRTLLHPRGSGPVTPSASVGTPLVVLTRSTQLRERCYSLELDRYQSANPDQGSTDLTTYIHAALQIIGFLAVLIGVALLLPLALWLIIDGVLVVLFSIAAEVVSRKGVSDGAR